MVAITRMPPTGDTRCSATCGRVRDRRTTYKATKTSSESQVVSHRDSARGGLQAGAGVGRRSSLAACDLDTRIALAEGDGQAGSACSALSARILTVKPTVPVADDPGSNVFDLIQQQVSLVIQHGPGAGESQRSGRAVQQHRAQIRSPTARSSGSAATGSCAAVPPHGRSCVSRPQPRIS